VLIVQIIVSSAHRLTSVSFATEVSHSQTLIHANNQLISQMTIPNQWHAKMYNIDQKKVIANGVTLN